MPTILGDVIIPTFPKDFGKTLQACIADSAQTAKEAVASGEAVRWTHAQGCTNTSLASSSIGAVEAAEEMIAYSFDPSKAEPADEPFFGVHFREARKALRVLFRR